MPNLPDIQISTARKDQSTGLKRFAFGENYAATGTRGVNSRREVWTWSWEGLTLEQYIELEDFFLGLEGAIIPWTAPGRDEKRYTLLENPITLDIPEGQVDGFRIQVRVGQTFRNA